MTLSDFLDRLRDALTPSADDAARMKGQLQRRIEPPALLSRAVESLTPEADAKSRIWQRIQPQLAGAPTKSLLDRMREWLEPAPQTKLDIRSAVMARLGPQQASAGPHWFLKWSLAFAGFALIVRTSPLLFLAPEIGASSSVTVQATVGGVSVGREGLLQSVTTDLTLLEPTLIQTDAGGQATVSLHAYGVVRLGPDTAVEIRDLAARPEVTPTVVLRRGTIWVQGLLFSPLQGVTVATSAGTFTLHEGSLSLSTDGDGVTADVWDRSVDLRAGDSALTLDGGQRARLRTGAEPEVSRLNDPTEDDSWVNQNLERDAVHRREIAQWQREVRAASAGILPTSALYPVKRAAEAVDLLLTFDSDTRFQKRLQQAETRLNEAAALLPDSGSGSAIAVSAVETLKQAASGSVVEPVVTDTGTGATAVATMPIVESLLAEYQETILELSAAELEAKSASGAAVPSIVGQELAASASELSAALPDDSSYVLKQTVLKTSAALANGGTDPTTVDDTLLLDALTSLKTTLQDEPTTDLTDIQAISPYLEALTAGTGNHSEEIRREANALANTIDTLQRQVRDPQEQPAETATAHLPVSPPSPRSLTEDEVNALVTDMYARIFVYSLPRSRYNQLMHEFQLLEGHPDQGRILRRLYHVLPENGLAPYVRTELRRLQESHRGSSSACADCELPPSDQAPEELPIEG